MKKIKDKIRKWLDVPQTSGLKTFADDVAKLEKEMWKHRNLLEKRVVVNCPACSKTLLLWPLETEAYYVRDGEAYHVKCYAKIRPNSGEK